MWRQGKIYSFMAIGGWEPCAHYRKSKDEKARAVRQRATKSKQSRFNIARLSDHSLL